MLDGLPARLATAALLAGGLSCAAAAACPPGAYGTGPDAFVVLGEPLAAPAGGQRYLFRDGRRGGTADAHAPVTCSADVVLYTAADGQQRRWPRLAIRETGTTFDSAATTLAGRLIEPAGPPDATRPLVVLVHGSERTAAVAAVYGHLLAAQGIVVFAYDKRGTGASGGEYTQNFELLADDAAAALGEARRLAAGRFGRAGFFGGSQGGWVAPLAATRSQADFVAVGFGLVVSPLEEDREQLLAEAQAMGLDAAAMAQVDRLSRATARLMLTRFREGYDDLAAVRRDIGDAAWARTIAGEYSGDMLRMSDRDLRRIGRARFDNLELIWDYDAEATLRQLKIPLLWILAGEDQEAPVATTQAILARLRAEGRPVDTYLFPGTDHGMVEFRTAPDGSRTYTRITDGYLKLLADWLKGTVHGRYGRAEKLER